MYNFLNNLDFRPPAAGACGEAGVSLDHRQWTGLTLLDAGQDGPSSVEWHVVAGAGQHASPISDGPAWGWVQRDAGYPSLRDSPQYLFLKGSCCLHCFYSYNKYCDRR